MRWREKKHKEGLGGAAERSCQGCFQAYLCVCACAMAGVGVREFEGSVVNPVSCMPWPCYVEGIHCHLLRDCLKWSEPQRHKKQSAHCELSGAF